MTLRTFKKEVSISNSVYKFIGLVGTSEFSREEEAKIAVEKAGESLRELRIAEIEKPDLKLENGNVVAYRARAKDSFKYGTELLIHQQCHWFCKFAYENSRTSNKRLLLVIYIKTKNFLCKL